MPDKLRGRPPKPLDPTASHAARLGAEIRERRLAKGLTQQALGELIGCSAQQVSTVEHAQGPVSRRFVRACDAALGAQGALEELLPAVLMEHVTQREDRAAARSRDLQSTAGEPIGIGGAAVDGGRTWSDRPVSTDQAVAAIRQALMAHAVFASDRSGPAPDLGVLYRRVNSGWCAFQSSRYSLLADQFLVTLRQAQLAARRYEGRERLAAAGLLSMLYQLGTVALLKLGDVETAWLAADRGVAAAEQSEHPLVLGSAGRMLAYVFLDAGECQRAHQVGLAAAAGLERHPHASATRISVLGALYLKSAVAAARRGDRSTAIDLLDEAGRAASQLNADRNDFWTAFGPTNVAVHAVTIAVELGEPGYALEQARRVRLSRLPVPERRAHHLIDVAKAHGQSRQDSEAVKLVLAAEKLAPEEVRLRPTTRTLIADILHRAPVVGDELRGLAHRLTAA
jgi:transcriptional regulator with XRE-family HTH domain